MIRRLLLACVFAAGLSGLACEGPGRAVEAGRTPAPLPEEAKLPLAKLTPPVQRPVNAPGSETLPQRAAEIVVRAEALIARGDYVQAINLLERAVGFAPKSPRIHRGLGLSYAAVGDRAKATPHLHASAGAAPDNVRVQLLLAQYAVMQRKFEQAAIHLRRALLCSDAADENPDTAEALLRLGLLLERRGCWTAALECYRRLGRLIAEHGRSYSERGFLRPLITRPEQCMVAEGRLLLKLRKPDEAAVLLERAYRRDKTDPQAGRLAVAALLETGDFERSEGIVMEMLTEPARRREAIASAVQWCRARKDPSAPAAMLSRYLADGGSDSAFVVAMAEVAAELGRADEAARILSKYLSKVPQDGVVAMRLARLYVRTGDLPAAAKQFAVMLAAEAADTSRVCEEVSGLARRGIKKDLVDELAAAASEEAELKPALLCVAAMLAETIEQRDKAVSLLRQAIRADKKFWPAYEVLEGLYVAAGDIEAIDKLIRQVSEVAGDTYFRFYFVGKSQLDRGCVSDAIGNLEQARARRDRHVPTLLLLGRAYVRARQFRNAERRLLAAFGLAGDDIAVIRELFDLYMMQHRRADAGRVIAGFLRDNPRNIPARVLLGRFYFLTNQTKQARRILQTLLSEAPDNVEVGLLEILFDLPPDFQADGTIPARQAASALKKVRRILRLDARNVPANRLYASLLVSKGRHAEAAEVWASLHRRMPYDVRTASAWLDALINAGKSEQAAAAIEEISRRKVTGTAMRMLVLESLLRIKRYDLAESLAEQWLAAPTDKRELALLRLRAMKVYEAAEHYGKAQRLLDRWIALGPEEDLLSSLRREKLRIYGLAKQYDEAVAYAGKWIRNEPTNSEPRGALLTVLMEAKQYDKAHAVVDEWLGSGGDVRMLDRLRMTKLLLYARQSRFDELLRFGRKWIAQDPNSAEPYHGLLAILLEHEKYNQALKVAEDWLAHQEKLPPADPKRAEKVFRAKGAVVEVLLLAGRKRQALARARAFVRAEPEDVRALNILRAALAALDKDEEVLKISEKIYKLDPDDPGINNDLGYTWTDRGVNLQKAESMIRKALAARPDEIAFKDSFGWVLYKQGRFAEARVVFDQVVSADEVWLHPIILDHAGDTCWRLGHRAEAIRLWNWAVEMAKKEKRPGSETKKVLAETPRKIKAGRRGGKPSLAPLGEGVSAPTGR